MLLVSVLSNIHNGIGHHIPYHKSVGVAAKMLGWSHLALYPKEDSTSSDLGPEWIPCLSKKGLYVSLGAGALWSPIKLALKTYGAINYRIGLTKFLRKIRNKNNKIILFFDDPAAPHIIILLSALYMIHSQRIKIWIMLRTRVGDNWLRVYFFSFSNRVLKLICGEKNVALLTDSDFLKRDLDKYFQGKINVMPVPHIGMLAAIENPEISKIIKRQTSEIFCWWPGSPRIEKGLGHIQKLALESPLKDIKINLILPAGVLEQSKAPKISIEIIPESLPREKYEKLMNEVDFILLPYDPKEYGERTSGIFVEAVAYGAMPIVTENTWMAKELEKFGLEILVVPWDCPALLQTMYLARNSPEASHKLRTMQKEYLIKHGEIAYSKKIGELGNNTKC